MYTCLRKPLRHYQRKYTASLFLPSHYLNQSYSSIVYPGIIYSGLQIKVYMCFSQYYFSECVGNESPTLLTLGSNYEKTHTYRIWNTSIPLDSNHMFCRYGCDLHLKIFRLYFRRGKTWGVSPRDLTYCSHKSVCIVTTNPGGSVLIAFISCYFQFRPVNVSILYLRCQYHARSESRFACLSHCYVSWCPLTTGIVTSQFPPRVAALATRHLTHFILACLNYAGLIPNV